MADVWPSFLRRLMFRTTRRTEGSPVDSRLLAGNGAVGAQVSKTPSLFLSYSRQDSAFIRPLVEALEDEGFDVWWDCELASGSHWSDELEAKLNECDVIVVAWSKSSIQSKWVLKEAMVGANRGVLHPIIIETVSPPASLAHLLAHDLSTWRGRLSCDVWRRFVASLAQKRGDSSTRSTFRAEEGPLFSRFDCSDRSVSLANGLLVPFYDHREGYRGWRPADRIRGARYISHALGMSVPLLHSADGFEATLYVYNRGHSSIPSGASSKMALTEMRLAEEEMEKLTILVERGNHSVYRHPKGGWLLEWLFTEAVVIMNDVRQFSSIYLSSWRNEFIKIRHSFPMEPSADDSARMTARRVRSIIAGLNFASLHCSHMEIG